MYIHSNYRYSYHNIHIEYPLSYLEDDSVLDAAWEYLSKVPEKELSDFLTFLIETWVDSLGTYSV